jgi:hypothetical protein
MKNWIENEKKEEYQSSVVYLESIKLAPKVNFLTIYKTIIIELFEEMKKTAIWLDDLIDQSITRGVGHIEKNRLIEEKYLDKKITPSFSSLPLLLRSLIDDNENAKKILMGEKKLINLKPFNLDSPIDNEFSATRCLGAYINLCTRGPQSLNGQNPPGRNKALYIFLDEIELLNDFSPAEVLSINQGIRDLLNACPENLCLLLGLTGDIEIVPALFEHPVMRRMSREPIPIDPMDNDQAVIFLKEVLKSSRLNPKDPDEYPFREEALMKIAEETTDKTAGGLFRNCRRVLENAVLEKRLKPNGWIEVKDVEDFIYR